MPFIIANLGDIYAGGVGGVTPLPETGIPNVYTGFVQELPGPIGVLISISKV